MPAARRVLPLPPAAAFALVTDLPRHDRWIPFTRVQGPVTPRVGARYSALSLGVLRDRMQLAEWRPPSDDGEPGIATYVKHGPLLLGSATLTVRPNGTEPTPSSSLVTWSYDSWLAGLPRRATRAAVSAFGVAMAASALRRMARAARADRL